LTASSDVKKWKCHRASRSRNVTRSSSFPLPRMIRRRFPATVVHGHLPALGRHRPRLQLPACQPLALVFHHQTPSPACSCASGALFFSPQAASEPLPPRSRGLGQSPNYLASLHPQILLKNRKETGGAKRGAADVGHVLWKPARSGTARSPKRSNPR
jgi:hypothetical protein